MAKGFRRVIATVLVIMMILSTGEPALMVEGADISLPVTDIAESQGATGAEESSMTDQGGVSVQLDGGSQADELNPSGGTSQGDENGQIAGTNQEAEINQADKTGQTDGSSLPDGINQGGKTDPEDKTSQPDETDQSDKTDQPDEMDQPDETSQPDETDQSDETSQSDATSQPDGVSQPDGMDQGDETSQADEIDDSEVSSTADGSDEPTGETTDDQIKAEKIDWSSRKNEFLFSYEQMTEQEDGWTLSVQFSFPLKDTEEYPSEGDTAILQLPIQWMEIADTDAAGEKRLLSPFIEKTAGEEKTEEAVALPIAEYEIKDGTVKFTFTDGIESEEIVSQITELKTRLTVPFIWKEGIQTEEEQEVVWMLQTYENNSKNEANLVIPALEKKQEDKKQVEEEQTEEKQTEEEQTEEKQTEEEQTEEKQTEEKQVEERQTEELADAPALLGVAPLAGSSYTMTNEKYTGKSEERHIYWIDNNNGQNTRPSVPSTISETDREKLRFSAKFTYKEGAEEKTVELTDLTWDKISSSTSTVSMTNLGGTGHWVLSASNILSSANVTINGTSRAGTFSGWTISTADDQVFANDQYTSVYVTGVNDQGIPVDQEGRPRPSAEDRRGWFYVQKLDYTSEIHLRTGTKTVFDQDELERLKAAILEAYSFFWKTGIKDSATGEDLNAGSTPLDADPNWMRIDWVDSEDHLVGTVTVPALEKYNLDGSELIFYVDGDEGNDVKITVAGMEDGDYLAESVVNDDVSNWGTNVTEVYSGGDLILTLTGTAEYNATKEWHDKADPNNRPQVDFYLWRFTDKGTGVTDINTAYQTAAAVKATYGDHKGQTAQVTIQAKSSGDTFAIDFFENFKDENGNVQKTDYLPKYDPEGYRYVYICREYMSGDDASRYETVYGKLVNDAFKDTLPSGYTGDRTAYDNSIYNDGTVSNLLTGTTTAPVTKTWVANAFQSEFADTIVEMTLYKRVKTADNSAVWEETTTKYRMGDEAQGGTPFIAEFLTQSHSVTVPKYNNEGEELQYCWVETGVYQGSDTTNLLAQSTSTTDKTFTLSQNGQTVNYKSQSEYSKNTDGNYSTTITNRIEDTTNYYVRKDWDPSIPEAVKNPVSLRMYRTGINNERQQLSTTINETTDFKLNGRVDDDPTPLYYGDVQVGQVQETSPWYAEYTELDKYDANGSQYDFIVFEGNPGKWTPEYSTILDDQGNTIRVITNRPIPGTGTTLLLRKRWLDDGDEQHRGTVTYTIYNIPEASRGNITPDVLNNTDVKVTEVRIDRSDEWWKQVYLENVTDDNGLLVLETSVASTDADGNPATISYTADKLNAIFALQHASTGTSGAAPYVTYETNYHKYEASYSMVEFEDNTFYTVTNRRLGNIDIEVTKTWKDGSTNTQISEQRKEFLDAIDDAGYKLVFQLVSNSSEVKVNYENNTVTAGNEAVPILKKDESEASAIQVLNTKDNTSVYEFYNLPKYDSMGRMVSYSVKEMLRPTNGTGDTGLVTIDSVIKDKKIETDYSFTITQSGYTVSEGLRHDKQTFSAVNQLTGSKDVFFWKEWNDAYRYQLGERPDLYLDLYQVKHNEDGSDKNPESLYLDRRWQFKDEWISLCDFGSMQKYDEYGFEIIYYAQEKILINKDAFDYTDVYYKYSTQMESKDVLASGQISAQEDLNKHVNELPKIGDEKDPVSGPGAPSDALKANASGTYLLKEYGIFVNELQADVVFNGKKIWANIPSGFLDEDLAEVTFRLYQFESGNEPDNDSNTQTEENGTYYLTGKDGTKSPEYASITIKNWKAQKYNNEYKFAIKYQGGNTNTVGADGTITVTSTDGNNLTIPKYDEDGNLYAYVIRESGDFSGTDVGDGHSLIFKQPIINNFAITNPYDSVKGKITVKKLLDTSNYEGTTVTNPSVSFTLTRQYKDTQPSTDGTYPMVTDTVFKQTKTISYSEFVNGSKEISFTDLEIYAPNGNKYVYTIEENENDLIQGGYTVSAGIGNHQDDSRLIEYTDGEYKVTGLYPKQDASAGQQLLDFFKSIPQRLGITPRDGEDTSYATFSNEYKAHLVPLYFGKRWTDGNNEANIRPKSLKFNISRSADAQPGQGNAIEEQNLGRLTITLTDQQFMKESVELTQDNSGFTTEKIHTNGTDLLAPIIKKVTVTSMDSYPLKTSGKWLIKVESVDDFAPNGMPWKYGIQETDVSWPYTGTGKFYLNYVAPSGTDTAGHFGDDTNPTVVTNSMQISSKMWKNWRYGSGDCNEKFTNPFNRAMRIEASLYLAAVDITDSPNTEPDVDQFNDEKIWKKAAGSEFEEALRGHYQSVVGNTTNFKLVKEIPYGAIASLGVREGASSTEFNYLPKVIQVNGRIYAMRYYIIETGFKLLESNMVIYQETFDPQFVDLSVQPEAAAEKYPGKSRVGYWLYTSAQILNDEGNLVDTEVLLVTPRVDSESDLKTVWETDFYQVFDKNVDQVSDCAIWPLVNYEVVSNTKRESTFANDIDLTSLKVTKNWANDQNNIYGTREESQTAGQWQISFQIQRKASTLQDINSNWKPSGHADITLSGGNEDSSKEQTITYLPVKVIEGNTATGYSITEYEYRARELYKSSPVDDGAVYKDTYTAKYEETGDDESGYSTAATNTMITIDLHAQKNWKQNSPTDKVTFELQYKKEGGTWSSFQTKAEVELDGTSETDATSKAYYEDSPWHAVWKGVPKVMTGSETKGEGTEKQTIYRVVEVSENAYGSDREGNALAGTGTEDDPYELDDPAAGSNDYSITNELTILKVEKTVEKYVDGATVNNEFTIKISGDMSGITVKYQKYTKADSGNDTKEGDLVTASISNNSFTFKLKDNQYVLIYGLKKEGIYKEGIYTVTETDPQGYTPSYQVTAADAEAPADGNTVTIPETKPTKTSPVVTVTNKRYGKLTVEKKDENGEALSGVTFQLKSSDYEDGPWDDVAGGVKTTGADGNADGKVVYEKLDLKKYYQITETAVPSGYNKLGEPVVVYLPYETTSNTSGSNPLYTISSGSDTKYYYADVTITIGNNKTLVMPTTAGTGFFWPGIAGLFVLAVGGGFYLYTGRRRRRKSS